MLKKSFTFILLLAIIVSICAAYATHFLKPFLKEKILGEAEKIFGKIEFSGFDIGLLKGIIFIKGLRIENIKFIKYHNAITADEVVLDIDLFLSLLRKSPIFQRIYLNGFVFDLKNRKNSISLIEPSFKIIKDAETKIIPNKLKRTQNALHIKRLLIENSKFIFVDYSVTAPPIVIEVININGDIENLLFEKGVLKGVAHLKGRLNSKDEGLLELDGSFAKSADAVDFDFEMNLDRVNFVRFEPYYSNTSFAILKEAKLDLDSKASCAMNRINAFQNARIYDIELCDINPTGKDILFGLPAKTVIEFFNDLKGDIKFDFSIVGTIDDPQFDPGPVIKQVLSNAMRDKIISKLQELPREVIKMSKETLNEKLRGSGKLKALEGEIEEKIEDIKKELKGLIEYNP